MLRFCVALILFCTAALAPAGDTFAPADSAVWPTEQAEAAGHPYDVPYGGHLPGGYERRIGSPYYWSVPGGTVPLAAGGGSSYAAAPGFGGQPSAAPAGGAGCGCNKGSQGPGNLMEIGPNPVNAGPGADRVAAAGPGGDPYTYHFGPGFYRSGEFGHYRFPYYSYRRPWYDVGHPVRVRDTNLPW